MKTKFRIREEIVSENGKEKSRFYCEHKFLWWWFSTFYSENVDGDCGPDVYFHTKREALVALRGVFSTPGPELKYHYLAESND
jgi:hypothetical protein